VKAVLPAKIMMNKNLKEAIELLKELDIATEKYKGIKNQRLILLKDAIHRTKRQIAVGH